MAVVLIDKGRKRQAECGHGRRGVQCLAPDEGRDGGDMRQRKGQARHEAFEVRGIPRACLQLKLEELCFSLMRSLRVRDGLTER